MRPLLDRKMPCKLRTFSHIQHADEPIDPKITRLGLLLRITNNRANDKIRGEFLRRFSPGVPMQI